MTRRPATLGTLAERLGIPLPEAPEDAAPPLPTVILSLLGGTLAGAALVAGLFIMIGGPEFDQAGSFTVGGGVLLGLAVALVRLRRSLFARQLAITCGVAGQILLSWALFLTLDPDVERPAGLLAATFCVGAVATWPLLRDPVYRFLTAGLAVVLIIWDASTVSVFGPPVVAALVVPAGLALLLRPWRAADLRSVGLALLLVPVPFFGMAMEHDQPVVSAAPFAIGTAWLLWPLLRGHAGRLAVGFAGLAALTVLLPGAAAALLVLALAWRLDSRALAGFGVAALAGFVVHFYYAQEVTLLVKSGLLLAGGVLTLGLWALTGRRRTGP